MDSAYLSSLANVAGVATAGTAILGVVFYRAHLPKWRYKALEEALKDTEEMWGIESPLLRNQELRQSIEVRINSCVP